MNAQDWLSFRTVSCSRSDSVWLVWHVWVAQYAARRQWCTAFSQAKCVFNLKAVGVGFVIACTALGQVPIRIIRFSLTNYHSTNAPFSHLSSEAGTIGPFAAKFWGAQSHPTAWKRSLCCYVNLYKQKGETVIPEEGKSENLYSLKGIRYKVKLLY
jgi:hypothetical protein